MKLTATSSLVALSQVLAVVALQPTSPQVQLFQDWMDAFAANDFEAVGAALADNLAWEMLPQSLNQPKQDKAGFLNFASSLRGQFATFNFTASLIAEQHGRLVHMTEPAGITLEGREYHNQIINTVDVKLIDGKYKITTMQEFVDSLYSSQWITTT
ncbi:hypothetical protein BKA62DRAFT_755953 [Auriculariales sp. MPI-PUGE-AT-0066]|nr:hypothetical protein BKA62DRAFT_755953 [Auriculariales sp. MPI-PUGE-AT-0066]